MADSDDEYDRKRRDKFRGEREANYRGVERPLRPREDWVERDNWSRPRPREYRPRDRGYSPTIEPQVKRMRADYYPHEAYYNPYAPYHPPAHREIPVAINPPAETNPNQMMSFKAFLATQDDNISDNDAIEKYNDYKLEFQRQQLNEFFVSHKDEEWFRLKYHPEDSVKRKEEQLAALKKRVDVFLDLYKAGKIENVTVDVKNTSDLIKLLDTVVIKLEGGTDEDLAVLDEVSEVVEAKDQNSVEIKNEKVEESDKVKEEKLEDEKPKVETNNKEENEKEEDKINNGEVIPDEKISTSEENNLDEKEEKIKDKPKNKIKKETKRTESFSGSDSSSSSSSESEEEEGEDKKSKSDKAESIKSDDEDVKVVEVEKVDLDKEEKTKPRALHKTTSIFLRNLSPTITRQEVEAICSRYPGYLRVALAEPQPERRWLRRGWVTFSRDANIKEICWNLNNIRLRDTELGAIVNRDLSRRIRAVNGVTAHKQVVRSDIKISAKVAQYLDSKANLWNDENTEKNSEQSFGFVSNNPILKNITDYLIEEASAEEDELLGIESKEKEEDDQNNLIDRDEELIKVLDRIVLYLRIVHSVDYYNHCEYPNEDEMPNRCGILHSRGPPPLSKTDLTPFIGAPVEAKMAPFLPEKPSSSGNNEKLDKLIQLAIKDEQTEVDKFVQANTRELSKDKWLCPLSGKKFKGPDFVRKHIFNKHAEKVEEVKKEVQFFNNYLRDPKRPMLHNEQQSQQQTAKREEVPAYTSPAYASSIYAPYTAPLRAGYFQQPLAPGFGQRTRGYARNRGQIDMRPVVHYRDLDAPREPEEFI